jgi:hypothetical protein
VILLLFLSISYLPLFSTLDFYLPFLSFFLSFFLTSTLQLTAVFTSLQKASPVMPSTAGVVVPVRVNTKKKKSKDFEDEAPELACVPRVSRIPRKEKAHHEFQVSTGPELEITLAYPLPLPILTAQDHLPHTDNYG